MTPKAENSHTLIVLDSIRKIVQALRYFSVSCEENLGLSAAQLFVLKKLNGTKPISVNELADLTFTHQSSVSVVVTRLVEKKLVSRQASGLDRRRVELKLTKKGLAIVDRSPETIQEQLAQSFEVLNVKDQERLATLLNKWVEGAGLNQDEPVMLFETPKRANRAR